jgi:DNA repair protein RadC
LVIHGENHQIYAAAQPSLEKLREKGAVGLSDEELVATILSMGTVGLDVRTISKKVAGLVREHREALGLQHLLDGPGIGLAKAAQVLPAFELARRYLANDAVKLSCAMDALSLLSGIAAKQQEHFVCISLNGANEVIKTRVVTIGLLDKAPVHPREVFADVIADRATSVICAHNHPSGDVQPSEADLRLHQELAEAGKLLGISVLDHIIIAKKGYYSYQESGLINS